jgi:hypothetical protein
MLGAGARDARRTDRYLDGLMDAEERGAIGAPMDLDLDPQVLYAARRLRAELIRPHPSFRFEEGLADRLARAAAQARGAAQPHAVAAFRTPEAIWAPAGRDRARGAQGWSSRRLPALGSRAARPLIVGGVASAISIGAVYVAWRWSRTSQAPTMARAVRAARSGRGHSSGRSRRAAVLHGILGVIS